MPMALIIKYLLPPWMSFYEKKVNFDPKVDSISRNSLTTLRDQKWSEKKIAMFMQYKVKFKNQLTPLESKLDKKFKEMGRIEHPLDVSFDESPISHDEAEK